MKRNSIRYGAIALALLTVSIRVHADGYEDDFNRAEFGSAWASHADSFEIKDGVLHAWMNEDANHGAVTRAQWGFGDAEISYDFMFDGADRFNFVVDDKNCKEVHAGHTCRVSVSKRGFSIQDDYTGVMNLKFRELRKDPANAEYVEKVLSETKVFVPYRFEEGRWYRMTVRMEGDLMSVAIDGKREGELKSPGLAHATNTQFGFTVIGRQMRYDNVKAKSL